MDIDTPQTRCETPQPLLHLPLALGQPGAAAQSGKRRPAGAASAGAAGQEQPGGGSEVAGQRKKQRATVEVKLSAV